VIWWIEGVTGLDFPIFLMIIIVAGWFVLALKGREWCLFNVEPTEDFHTVLEELTKKIDGNANLTNRQLAFLKEEVLRLSKSRGSDDVFRIVDEAIGFRASGRERSVARYPG